MNFLKLKVSIDDKEIKVPQGFTVLQACELAGVFIPRFCYHADLSVAGNCRMCLVAVAGSPKLVASCMMPVSDNMHIFTDSQTVRKAQQGVMEHLLINHPLDCPICDQGGECDLQDQAQYFGTTHGRFLGIKRAVEDKDIGPFIKTVMTRCIHCTRCIRFASEIAGISVLGTFGRGRATEVGTYVEKLFRSEISGNVIDLCPVGALTSKPSAFTARSWESKKINSVDFFDGMCSPLTYEVRGVEIFRVLPFKRTAQSNWISDKARFAFDGISFQRLSVPMLSSVSSMASDQLSEINWSTAFQLAKLDLTFSSKSLFCVGNLVDSYSLAMTYTNFLKQGGGCWIFHFPFFWSNVDFRSKFLYNQRYEDLKDKKVCVLINCNPKKEGAVFYGYLRQRITEGTLSVYQVGSQCDPSFISVGSSVLSLLSLVEGRHPFCKAIYLAENVVFVKGISMNQRRDSFNIDYLIDSMVNALYEVPAVGRQKPFFKYLDLNTKETSNFFHLHSNQVTAMDMSISNSYSNVIFEKNFFGCSFSTNFDSSFTQPVYNKVLSNTYYSGHHYDIGAAISTVVLPTPSFFEKKSLVIDMQGCAFKLEAVHNFSKSSKESIPSSLPFLV
jgi:NADH dehydrogenase (ubiquinone) Fe-S protein 1